TGVVTLTGTNTYSGGTTVSGGTLQGTTDSLQGDIVNNANVAFDQSASGTYAGAMGGTGHLIKSNTGVVTLTGTNTYSGGTTVSGGTLQGTTDSLQGDIVNNANVAFDQSASGTYAGAMGGTGHLIKSNTGVLTLTGTNTYSGGTTVNGGTLQGTTDSLQGDIVNNANVAFDQSASGIYAGAISGTGSLVKSNAGRLNLTGLNTYSGDTTINDGILSVNGSAANSRAIVNTSGTLGGSGTIGGISLNGGTLAPGNSIGTLNVAGDVDFSAGGVYAVEVDAAGNSDYINATGTATLTNGSVQVIPEAGTYNLSTDYTILTAAGGLGGTTFDSVSSTLAFLTPTLTYDANNVLLNLRRNTSDYASVSTTPNQVAVGTMLDQLFNTGTTSVDTVLSNLNNLTAAGARQAYDALSGVQHTYSNQVSLQSVNQFKGLLFDRINTPSPLLAAKESDRMLAYNDGETMTDAGSQLFDSNPPAEKEWWIRGVANYGNIDDTLNVSGADYNASGVAIGADYKLDDKLTLGAAFGQTRTDVDVDLGSMNVSTYQAALYGKKRLEDDYYVSGMAGIGYHNTEADRQVIVGLTNSIAKSDYNSWTGNMAIEGGRRFAINETGSVTPYAGIEYAHLYHEGFTERGAGEANLKVADNTQNSLRSAIGARIEQTWTTNKGYRVRPSVELAWVHEYLDDTAVLRAGFAPTPETTFSLDGSKLDRDRARVGLGLNMQLSDTASLTLGYQGEIAGSDERQDFSATYRMAW
ncbi:autotransporter domain-containing protein, partial [Thiomicrorhabdus sp.]|uniref:autotransporter family protein n=1 Tax=Thiomicrorhabdus sp. TaxID=2039724 RepID=UPI00356ADC84